MKISKEVKEALGALSAKDLQEIATEQNAPWSVVDAVVEQEALDALTEGVPDAEAQALEALIGVDPDRIADRLSAIQTRIQQAEELTDEQRTAYLEKLKGAADKLGVELPAIASTESEEEEEEEEEEGKQTPPPAKPAGKEDKAPTAAQILEAEDALNDYVDELEGVPEAEKKAVREALKPKVRSGELLGADNIKKAVDTRVEESKRAAERWKPGRTVAVGDTGEDLDRATEEKNTEVEKAQLAAL